jgi:hypothetical protein
MEKTKVLVEKSKNPSGQICLAPTKDVKLNKDFTLKQGIPFVSVSPLTYQKMKSPKSVTVWLHNGQLYFRANI